jgi:hypothetical protein
LKDRLSQFGCVAPENFGEDILICRLTIRKNEQ